MKRQLADSPPSEIRPPLPQDAVAGADAENRALSAGQSGRDGCEPVTAVRLVNSQTRERCQSIDGGCGQVPTGIRIVGLMAENNLHDVTASAHRLPFYILIRHSHRL